MSKVSFTHFTSGLRALGSCLLGGLFAVLVMGCGTTRMTDTTRTATEQLLISRAIDEAVSQLDFRFLARKKVFLEDAYLQTCVDKGYLISSLRQHLLACGCFLQEDRKSATFVIEPRAGGVGTDRHSLLIGVPQTTVPALVPGQPTNIPEIPVAKKTDQKGVAKIAVFAYNRMTGEPVWQSGIVQTVATANDLWLMGAGPFQQGTIRKGTAFAGQPVPLPTFITPNNKEEHHPPEVIPVSQGARWLKPNEGRRLPTTPEVIRASGTGSSP